MNLIWKRILIISAAAIFIFLVIYFLVIYTPQPPIMDMQYARAALTVASKNNADSYSKKLYKQAKSYYDSALENWKKENKRFLYFRDYSKVTKLAKLAVKTANQAADSSKITSSNLKTTLNQKINALNGLVVNIDDMFTSYPLTTETRNRISKGNMLLKEAQILYKKGFYLDVDKKITESEYLLTTSYETASGNLKNYFKSYPEWKKWVDKTIADSRDSGNYSIIVDKFSRKLIVYLEGTKKYEYSAELGRNWVGDKRVKGDKATPEGMYKIAGKFDSSKTKYYKALLLDYPNDEDTAKFKAAIEKGILPRSAKIGGLIEIHGNGGKGIDWTEGCIALTDSEMDAVFKIVKVGTPVTIVGSMQDLQHVMKR
ncbi:MAG: L,D-transpeptidase family protein [Bacteroidales bacterium]